MIILGKGKNQQNSKQNIQKMSQSTMAPDTYSNELQVYVNQEKAAVELMSSVGKLLFA